MTDGSEFWGVGATHYDWDPDVEVIVQRIFNQFSAVSCNTYANHPYPGWDGRSIDVWGPRGRGDPIGIDLSHRLRRFLFEMPGQPLIRHMILQHQWWLRGRGWQYWSRDDHSGRLRHLHVTYLPVPDWR